jgi:hypothetical protein
MLVAMRWREAALDSTPMNPCFRRSRQDAGSVTVCDRFASGDDAVLFYPMATVSSPGVPDLL